MARRRIVALTVALTLLNGALAALVLLIWHVGQEAVQAPQHLPVRRLTSPDLSVLNAPPRRIVDTAAIQDNALFHSRRSFYQAPPPSQAVPRPDYEFAGTLRLPQGKRVAFVRKKSDQSTRTLHVDDDFDGWRVESIEGDRVVLKHEDERYELASAVANQGLVRAGAAARVAQSNLHILGTPATTRSAPSALSVESVRTYRPPPP
jgi:hypothetical protein